MKAFDFKNDFGHTKHLNDCKLICEYLEDIGNLNTSKRNIDRYYADFSNKVLSKDWAEISSDNLYDFATWLSMQEI